MLPKETIDPSELTAAVRAAEDDQSFALLDWEVQGLSTGGAVNPDGLLRISGGCGAAGLGRDVCAPGSPNAAVPSSWTGRLGSRAP